MNYYYLFKLYILIAKACYVCKDHLEPIVSKSFVRCSLQFYYISYAFHRNCFNLPQLFQFANSCPQLSIRKFHFKYFDLCLNSDDKFHSFEWKIGNSFNSNCLTREHFPLHVFLTVYIFRFFYFLGYNDVSSSFFNRCVNIIGIPLR